MPHADDITPGISAALGLTKAVGQSFFFFFRETTVAAVDNHIDGSDYLSKLRLCLVPR